MVAAVIALIFFIVVFVGGRDSEDMRNLAQAFAPFMIGLGALVTFCTVLWRGAIATRQTEEQQRQNDSKEEADLGLLLEKGHEYTAKNTTNDIALGIAMLDTVAQAENGKYAPYALHEITRQLKPCFLMGRSDRERIFELIKGVFERLASDEQKRHRRPQTVVELDFYTNEKIKNTVVRIFPNMPPCRIKGGNFLVGAEETKLLEDEMCGVIFAYTDITPKSMASSGELERLGGFGGSVKYLPKVTSRRFAHCVISNFDIGQIGDVSGVVELPEVVFRSCNLSNTEFTSRGWSEICEFENCYYAESAPPFFNFAGEHEAIDSKVLEAHGISNWVKADSQFSF
ncbi:hypothetical protein BKI51_18845 [Alphaproteobacteria bacterium AO1-B]|nr:hypothetical protein BKI51_18845 [Alphaproteobacteria bacterium AO1-B]